MAIQYLSTAGVTNLLNALKTKLVPQTRKINNKALSADITLSASDVSAVPTTRKVNSKALSTDISLTAADVGAATMAQVNSALETALNNFSQASMVVVTTLPTTYTTMNAHCIFLMANSGTAPNAYDEYVWVTDTTNDTHALEKIGTTAVDLTNYLKTTDMVELTTAEITTLVTNAFA